MTETHLKELGHKNPKRLQEVRDLLKSIVATFNISELGRHEYFQAIDNPEFKDIEDSYQYQSAVASMCEVLLTINIKDYKGVTNPLIKIQTPPQFLSESL